MTFPRELLSFAPSEETAVATFVRDSSVYMQVPTVVPKPHRLSPENL